MPEEIQQEPDAIISPLGDDVISPNDTVEAPEPVEPAVETPETPEEPKAPAELAVAPVVEAPVEEPAPKVAPIEEPVIENPGEFKPTDYSFEIKDAEGKVYKINSIEDIDALPSDIDFGTPANLMKAQNALNRMTTGLEAEKKAYEQSKQAYEANETSRQQAQATIEQTLNEIAYLEKKGSLPPVDPKYDALNWADPEVAKQPGVKERIELLNFRFSENQERSKLNLPPMTLLEAHTQLELQNYRKAEADATTKENTIRKQKGGMIGGGGGTPTINTPDDMIIGEGGNIRSIAL